MLPKMETSIMMKVRGCTRSDDREVFATGNCLPVPAALLLLLLFNTTRTFRTPKHEVWTAVQFTNSRKENVG